MINIPAPKPRLSISILKQRIAGLVLSQAMPRLVRCELKLTLTVKGRLSLCLCLSHAGQTTPCAKLVHRHVTFFKSQLRNSRYPTSGLLVLRATSTPPSACWKSASPDAASAGLKMRLWTLPGLACCLNKARLSQIFN